MKTKVSRDKGAGFILGVVYTLLGGFFVILGAILTAVLYGQEACMTGIIFAAVGSAFFILGVVFLALQSRKRKTAQRLVEAGRFLWAEIVEFSPNFNVSINNRHPYIVRARYIDGNGTVHIFKSPNVYQYFDHSMLNRQVKVYIEDNRFKKYYMDIEGALPNIQEH